MSKTISIQQDDGPICDEIGKKAGYIFLHGYVMTEKSYHSVIYHGFVCVFVLQLKLFQSTFSVNNTCWTFFSFPLCLATPSYVIPGSTNPNPRLQNHRHQAGDVTRTTSDCFTHIGCALWKKPFCSMFSHFAFEKKSYSVRLFFPPWISNRPETHIIYLIALTGKIHNKDL